ncbi:MAG: hypothetical protein V7L25_08885 [Nostoc sp.]|uniref:hypothetical protein n=1 Tax=Nostoc sp. TaxID=1180 RepID=UPI002FEFDF06
MWVSVSRFLALVEDVLGETLPQIHEAGKILLEGVTKQQLDISINFYQLLPGGQT